MTSDPPRLKYGGGPSRALLRAAEVDRPSSAARRRALAVASAVTTLGATSAVAAAGSGAVAKGILLWVCVGAAGGSTMALAVSELVQPAQSARPVAVSSASPARAAAAPNDDRVAPALPEVPSPSASTRELAPPPAAAKPPTTAVEPWIASLPAASAASFGDDPRKPTLFEELRLIEAARASVGRGAPSAALSVLDAYDEAYPRGQFQPESLALRIQALSQGGDTVGARGLVTQFQQRYPRHPLLSRVLSAVGQ